MDKGGFVDRRNEYIVRAWNSVRLGNPNLTFGGWSDFIVRLFEIEKRNRTHTFKNKEIGAVFIKISLVKKILFLHHQN